MPAHRMSDNNSIGRTFNMLAFQDSALLRLGIPFAQSLPTVQKNHKLLNFPEKDPMKTNPEVIKGY